MRKRKQFSNHMPQANLQILCTMLSTLFPAPHLFLSHRIFNSLSCSSWSFLPPSLLHRESQGWKRAGFTCPPLSRESKQNKAKSWCVPYIKAFHHCPRSRTLQEEATCTASRLLMVLLLSCYFSPSANRVNFGGGREREFFPSLMMVRFWKASLLGTAWVILKLVFSYHCFPIKILCSSFPWIWTCVIQCSSVPSSLPDS